MQHASSPLGRGPRAPAGCAACRTRASRGRSGEQPLALSPLAGELPRAADRLALFARPLLRRFLEELFSLELAKDAFALQLLLEHLQCLVDIVVANENLQT